MTRYTLSGTNEGEFYNFCYRELDVYYLRKHLEFRPNLNGFVKADLLEECALSSDKMCPLTVRTTQSPSNTSGTSPKKRKRGESEIALAIRKFGNTQMCAELTKQKLRFMQKEDSRREAEHQQQKRKSILEEWEKVQSNIRFLRNNIRKIY